MRIIKQDIIEILSVPFLAINIIRLSTWFTMVILEKTIDCIAHTKIILICNTRKVRQEYHVLSSPSIPWLIGGLCNGLEGQLFLGLLVLVFMGKLSLISVHCVAWQKSYACRHTSWTLHTSRINQSHQQGAISYISTPRPNGLIVTCPHNTSRW